MNLLEQSEKARQIFCPDCGNVVERMEPIVGDSTKKRPADFVFVPCGHHGYPLTLPPLVTHRDGLSHAVSACRRPLLHGASASALVDRGALQVVIQLAQAYLDDPQASGLPMDPRAKAALDRAAGKSGDGSADYGDEPPLSGV